MALLSNEEKQERNRARCREYRENNRDYLKAKNAAWYIANKEKIKEYKASRVRENRIHSQNYYWKNRDSILTSEMNKAKSRRWRANNREQERVRVREMRWKNIELTRIRAREYTSRRKSKILGNPWSLSISDNDLSRLLRDKCCGYCRTAIINTPHLDHIIPISRGGRHSISNLIISCQLCNLTKYNFTVAEWRYRHGAKVWWVGG